MLALGLLLSRRSRCEDPSSSCFVFDCLSIFCWTPLPCTLKHQPVVAQRGARKVVAKHSTDKREGLRKPWADSCKAVSVRSTQIRTRVPVGKCSSSLKSPLLSPSTSALNEVLRRSFFVSSRLRWPFIPFGSVPKFSGGFTSKPKTSSNEPEVPGLVGQGGSGSLGQSLS